RWPAFTRFLDDGRICLTNNAAERALRGLALGRKSWLFAGSERGAKRAAIMYTLIQTAKLNDVDPQAWLADVLARIGETLQTELAELQPGNGDSGALSRQQAAKARPTREVYPPWDGDGCRARRGAPAASRGRAPRSPAYRRLAMRSGRLRRKTARTRAI